MIGLSQRVAHERLTRICFVDYDREIALVAERKDPASGDRQIIAVGRLVKLHDHNEVEAAVLVSDAVQKRGLGTELVRRLVEVAWLEGRKWVVADFLPENVAMQTVFRRLGFELRHSTRDRLTKATLPLDDWPSTVGSQPASATEVSAK